MSPEFIDFLVLIIIANATPVLVRFLFGRRLDTPIDLGHKLRDGHRLFGASKTWRGLAGAMLTTSIAAWLLGHPVLIGAAVAILALLGDLASSFIKRRLALKSGQMAPLLDQVPEALLPAALLMDQFALTAGAVIILVLCFIVAELLLSFMFFILGVRKSPY
ncbi:MAG: CDP-archaeol synthase [Gammaproteobacteria bacterium]